MVHRGGLETSPEKNKKDDFNICIGDDAKTANDEIYDEKIEELTPKVKQIKRLVNKASTKTTSLPFSDHSISQSVVRVERSRLIRKKNHHPNLKADNSVKSTRLSPIRAGLRSNSLESHSSATSNNNNAKGKKKKVNNNKKVIPKPIDSPPEETVNPVSDESKNSQLKLSQQLPLKFICSLPLDRLSGILENLQIEKISTKCPMSVEDETLPPDDKTCVDQQQNISQCKILCLYCDKRISTVKVRARHIERFHTISKERRSSTRNPVTPSQDSKDSTGGTLAISSSSSSAPSTPKSSSTNVLFSGCSFCSKSSKLQAFALENDLNALFYHLVDLHSDKYFGCKLCAIRFQNATKLDDHVQQTHAQTSKTTQPTGDVSSSLGLVEEDRNSTEFEKSTPTKTRRQVKQFAAVDVGRSNAETQPAKAQTSSAATLSVNRNGSMFSNDEPFLSRLGVTQNRLPRGRKGIRNRRQTNVDSVKPDTSLMSVKTRSKVGRVVTSNEPIETIFRTPTLNTRTEPLSCTFDEDFYEKVFINVRTNLSCHLDGKLGKNLDVNRPQSPPPLMPAIRSTVVKSPYIVESEVHTATSLSALTAFPTLLTAEQYGCDFGTAKIKRPITKHSWKWKWDSVKKYKYVNEGGKIVKKIKQPMLGLRDLSKLDMWTQLTMRQKHEMARKQTEVSTSTSLVEASEYSREEKQKQIDQLNTILDSRRLPQIILEQNEQTIIKLEIFDEGYRYLAEELTRESPCEEPSTSLSTNRIIPANLNLIPKRWLGDSLADKVVLSGEWARPRCYVCFGCGARFDKLKALEEHKMFRHPHVYSTHYEIVGRELIEGNLYKHFFIPMKALNRHREYAQGVLVNKKTEDNVSKSSTNSANEDESLDSLQSMTASFTTLSSSKLSDDCDTDTKTAIENVSSSYTEPSTLSSKNENSIAIVSNPSVDCTKCNRNCHGILDLYRHMLDCSGDYAWILAKKKKYRYYGSRKRRQFNKHNIASLHMHKRKMKETKDEHEPEETPKKKPSNMSPSTPRPRPSDADSIRKMLENLPPKRVCREIIPNATKPRPRIFKTTAGRKIQQAQVGKCKSSNTTLTAISKKLLRNHKLRAIVDKDKISRSNKILENKRKSSRIKSSILVNKKPQSESKINKKTETGKGGIVRKIGATTKRFVKKIKKRFLGEKQATTPENNGDKSAAKKAAKLSAVRKLTFDKEQEENNEQDALTEEKSSSDPKKDAPSNSEASHSDKEDTKKESSLNDCKDQIPVENHSSKSGKTTVEKNLEKYDGSTEDLNQQQRELSTSTEDLRKGPQGLLHNQVSPTTKRRSKKINDCIAMLTGKLQEKLGKPFLECKETVNNENAKTMNATVTAAENSNVPSSNEAKDTKVPKRKAFTRRIVKCDPPAETKTISENKEQEPTPVKDLNPIKQSILVKDPNPVKDPIPVRDPVLVKNPIPVKDTFKEPISVKDVTPVKEPEKKEMSVAIVGDNPITKPAKKPIAEAKVQPIEKFNAILPTVIPLQHRQEVPASKLEIAATSLKQPGTLPAKKIVPPTVTIEIKTPPSAMAKETSRKPPSVRKPLSKQQCVYTADTIRVPCIKPPQLNIPQFNPLQVTAPRGGMIAKRRQTIAGAPNDFLMEMNTPRCANTYNNLPFELEVPLDLSKKPKRTSPKAKVTPKAFPPHIPQISVKPASALMPPMQFTLPILSQTQIIPIMCESMQQKVQQMPHQGPSAVFPKEIVKNSPIVATSRKRATNTKKQDPLLNTFAGGALINLPVNPPPPKRVSKKPILVELDKCQPNFALPPVTNSVSAKELLPSLPLPPVMASKFNKPTDPVDIGSKSIVSNLPQPDVVLKAIETYAPVVAKVCAPVQCVVPQQIKELPQATITPAQNHVSKPCLVAENPSSVQTKGTKETTKTNKKSPQASPKKDSPAPNLTLPKPQVENTAEAAITKVENKPEPSAESQKSMPTRRSKRNKTNSPNEDKIITNNSPPSALKEVEEIAASFVSDDEHETQDVEPTKPSSQPEVEAPEVPTIKPLVDDKQKEAIVETKTVEAEPVEIETPNADPKVDKLQLPLEDEPSTTPPADSTESSTPNNQDSSKKPRRRRKNELAAIVADQLLESFKEVDKSRIDDLKKLENLAYEKSEDLLLTGMRLMPTTKRKNVLENKKEPAPEPEPKVVPAKESKKQKSETAKEKSVKVQKDEPEPSKDAKDGPKADEKSKQQKDVQEVAMKPQQQISKTDPKSKPLPLDFGNYRTNSLDSWSQRNPAPANPVLVSPENDKSPTNDVAAGHKKSKKKQMKKRDKKIEIENINQLRTGLESFTFSKDVVENTKEEQPAPASARSSEPALSIVGLFTQTQRNASGLQANNREPDPSAMGNISSIKSTSSILRPSILAASLETATNKENPCQSDRKSSISSRDPRLNKNIHTEETDQTTAAPEVTSRLATLRQRRKSLADVNPPSARQNSRSTHAKRSEASSRRNSLVFDDDDDDNYLTAIAKRVNEDIMSAEDKDFNLANDGFDLANSFLDMDDPFGRPSTSMSVRSAPNFNDDRSNMDTMDATNTDLIDMDVDDDMSVYTTFSQDTSRSKGRRRRRRRSVLLTRKPKKTNINMLESSVTYDCLLCNKKFAKPAALNKHQLTIAHVSKVSEQEYLNATRKKEEAVNETVAVAGSAAKTTPAAEGPKPDSILNNSQNIRLEERIDPPKPVEVREKPTEKVEKPPQPKVPYLPPNSILNQSGIEPISSPEQNYERYSTKTTSRLTLNPDERLFYECCNILKGSETPLVERTYPIVPPTTYAYDLQVKPVTPKSTNERYSYIKQSTAEASGKRDGGIYPRIDVNQFSDISSDSNPACAQPPPIMSVNYAQMHVLSGAKDQAVLPNDDGDGGALRSNIPRENPVMQIASLASPNTATPMTARTFVNQPSQIGAHHHGMESVTAITQKQNFISPLHSASSQSSTITTTTCRLKTKAAMKGYDNLKVSIPTVGLDMEHALERSPRPGCKLTTLAEIALGNETPMTALTSFTPAMQMHSEQKSKCKSKPCDLTQQFPSLLSQSKQNEEPPTKKRDKSPVKESSPIISVHDTESCMPIALSSPKKPESIIAKDIYEFDDSENTPISKAIQSPFKTGDDNEGAPKKAIIIPERPFKNIGMEEQEGIKFQKPETPAINDENTTSTVTYSDRDDFVYGSISGGDDDNENEVEDNKDENVNSAESSNSSAFTAKTFENKSLIMGRIFKNAKTKPKIAVEKPKLPTPEPPKQIPKQELDRLFDTLRGLDENRQANASKEERQENAANTSRAKETQPGKRKTAAAAKTAKSKANANKINKKLTNKEERTSKEIAQLHTELGMTPAEIAELFSEGQRKSQRRCAVNRPKKLVEIWSSDEFEEFLSTKDIIALIEEKEQKTKKKRKTSSTTTKKANQPQTSTNNNTKSADDQKATSARLQSEDESAKNATPPKSLRKNSNTAQPSKAATTENHKKVNPPKGKKKVPTATANVLAQTKGASKSQKEVKSSSRKNPIEVLKNNSSPFKKPTQRNIPLKAADDSESDFEAELNRKSKAGTIRNRRKTISGQLENDAGSSGSAKKVTTKQKSVTETTSTPRTSNNKPTSVADSQVRPQARRKRIASEMLYYWSSSSDEEFGRIESTHEDEDHIDESENYQQHGWIVGDSHKKLVTLLAIAKGNKKVDDCGVKEINSKKKS